MKLKQRRKNRSLGSSADPARLNPCRTLVPAHLAHVTSASLSHAWPSLRPARPVHLVQVGPASSPGRSIPMPILFLQRTLLHRTYGIDTVPKRTS